MSIIEILAILRDTPLPTILVIVGCIFLVLAVVSRIGTYIKVSPKQQRWAGGIGGLLLILGIGLYIVPPPPPTPTTVAIVWTLAHFE